MTLLTILLLKHHYPCFILSWYNVVGTVQLSILVKVVDLTSIIWPLKIGSRFMLFRKTETCPYSMIPWPNKENVVAFKRGNRNLHDPTGLILKGIDHMSEPLSILILFKQQQILMVVGIPIRLGCHGDKRLSP